LTISIFGFSRSASLPPFKLIHLGRSRSSWSALKLCIANFTTTELSKNYVDFRGHFFWRTRKASEDVIGILAGGQPIGQTF